MSPVDTWRAIDGLERRGWTEQAIADALALPLRTIRRLKLLAQPHPPMLEVIAAGNIPTEDQLRTIAAAARTEQAQAWKKHRARKGLVRACPRARKAPHALQSGSVQR